MATDSPTLIRVHSVWYGWRSAEVCADALTDVHWRQPAGAPHRLIHAYIACATIETGDIPHECCDRSSHRLLVCVLKRHTPPSVFAALMRRADAYDARPRHAESRTAISV